LTPTSEAIPPRTSIQNLRFEFDTPPPGEGWSGVERRGIWTDSTESTLRFQVEPQSYHITFRIVGILQPEILASLRSYVNDAPITLSQSKEVRGAVLFEGVIPKEIMSDAQEPTILKFIVDQVVSPQSLGIGQDSRTLGLMFDWIQLTPNPQADAPLTIIQTLRFEFNTPPPGEGWSDVESRGVWTNAVLSTLLFQVEPQSYRITFRIVGALQPEILASLQFYVNETPIPLSQSPDTQGATLFEGAIPKEAISDTQEPTQFIFRTDQVVSPQSLGMGEDLRTLGLMFDWIQLTPTSEATAPTSLPPILQFEFDTPPPGEGWASPEGTSTWTISTTSTLRFEIEPRRYRIQFRILNALLPENLANLQLYINNSLIPLNLSQDAESATLFEGVIPQEIIANAQQPIEFKFVIVQVVSPQSLGISQDTRTLGLLFDWLQLTPS